MSLISLKDVSVGYNDRQKVLDHVNLDILPNDFIGVIGPNGGGKTTLVKTILKALPYSGEVQYSPVIGSDGYRAIGYLPQVSDIDKSFPISVCEVVLSGLQARKRLFGRYSAADKAKALQLLDLCGIESIARRPIGELSGGQLQRTLLCRALISDPKVLILDEPANFVDNKFEKELYAILRQLNDRMAIIMVSHDLGTITSHVKSIVCVNRHVHRHNSNVITPEQLHNYDCPIQIVSHGTVPHTILEEHAD
jgi:ABC-type Mn/Zn transport systems, ATPase component